MLLSIGVQLKVSKKLGAKKLSRERMLGADQAASIPSRIQQDQAHPAVRLPGLGYGQTGPASGPYYCDSLLEMHPESFCALADKLAVKVSDHHALDASTAAVAGRRYIKQRGQRPASRQLLRCESAVPKGSSSV